MPVTHLVRLVDKTRSYLFPQEHGISVHHSIFSTSSLLYFRIIACIYLSSIYIMSITTTTSALNNIIYLTMQGYFLTWLFFLLVIQDYLINGFGKWGRVFPICNNLKYYIQIIYEIAFCIQLPITAIFWGFLFKIIINMPGVTGWVIFVNANLHAGPFIVLCIDMVMNTFRFPSSHYVPVLVFGLLYAIVNVSYSLTAAIIYKPIDWVSVLSYILMGGAVVMTFFMHWLGRWIYLTFKKDKVEGSMTEELIGGSSSGKEQHQKKTQSGKEQENKEQLDHSMIQNDDL